MCVQPDFTHTRRESPDWTPLSDKDGVQTILPGLQDHSCMALVHFPMFVSCHSPSWAPDFNRTPRYIIFLTGGLHHGSARAAASMLPGSFPLIFQCPAQMSILPGWSLLLFPDIFIVLGLDWTTTALMFITMLHNVTMWFIAPGHVCMGGPPLPATPTSPRVGQIFPKLGKVCFSMPWTPRVWTSTQMCDCSKISFCSICSKSKYEMNILSRLTCHNHCLCSSPTVTRGIHVLSPPLWNPNACSRAH